MATLSTGSYNLSEIDFASYPDYFNFDVSFYVYGLHCSHISNDGVNVMYTIADDSLELAAALFGQSMTTLPVFADGIWEDGFSTILITEEQTDETDEYTQLTSLATITRLDEINYLRAGRWTAKTVDFSSSGISESVDTQQLVGYLYKADDTSVMMAGITLLYYSDDNIQITATTPYGDVALWSSTDDWGEYTGLQLVGAQQVDASVETIIKTLYDEPVVVTEYAISFTGSHVTKSGADTVLDDGGIVTVTLTADDGYILQSDNVTVTNAAATITQTSETVVTVSVTNPTDTVTITATATAVAPTYTIAAGTYKCASVVNGDDVTIIMPFTSNGTTFASMTFMSSTGSLYYDSTLVYSAKSWVISSNYKVIEVTSDTVVYTAENTFFTANFTKIKTIRTLTINGTVTTTWGGKPINQVTVDGVTYVMP